MASMLQIAWLAGIIEGEGCIISGAYETKGRAIKQFRLAVEMTDRDVLQRVRAILGEKAKLRERNPPSLNPDHKRPYILNLNGPSLAGWLMTIYPFMGERRQAKIREAIIFWKAMCGPKRGEEHRSAKLTWRDVEVIRDAFKVGVPIALLARQFGVSSSVVSNVVARNTWNRPPHAGMK